MAKLLLRSVGAGRTALLRLIGGGRQEPSREPAGAAAAAASAPTQFAGIDADGDTPEALRAELEELRVLLDQMRAERARKVA
jgi:hypothetical protein